MSGSRFFMAALALYFANSLFGQAVPPAQLTSQPQIPTVTGTLARTLNAEGGLIKLDVVVTDKSGEPVTGLDSTDFTLLDNGQPTKTLSFQEHAGTSARHHPPVELTLVIDTLRMPGMLASHEREEVEKFLRRNEGHLTQPVSIFKLLDSGLWLVAEASVDGNALAEEVARDGPVRLIRKAVGPQGLYGSQPEELPGLLALKALGDILTAERTRPGRKLLVWIGPRREENGAPFEQQRVFNMIVWFSTLLRESRVALYSYSEGENQRDLRAIRYKDFLGGVKSVRDAGFNSLDRRVLAVQSGGRVLDSASDLSDQIRHCAEEANSFYTLSFNPAHADHPSEYHDLKIQVRRPELSVHGGTGYYDQPYYQDQPNPATKFVTVGQLEQVILAAHGKSDRDLALRLSDLKLNERLSETKVSSWTANLRGPKAREALIALADASAFLSPPAAEIPADPSPDASAQRSIISLADDYLNDAIPKLPNFFATRTTVRYEETPPHDEGGSPIDFRPMHVVDSSKATVQYRHGQELLDAATKHMKPKADEPYLATYGTFGSILTAATDVLLASSDFSWSRWEQGAGGPRAVFRYIVPQEKSHFAVGYCCLPDGDGTISFQKLQGYHGEITIDPTTGAILRLTMEADLNSDLPVVRSDILVNYGAVEIGGKTYICPVKSVALWRSRTVTTLALPDWGESFRSYGPFATMLSDMTFGDYHIFRADSRVLTGPATPEQK